MIRFLAIVMCAWMPGSVCGEAPAPGPDLLRFVNGDQLHGSFEGIADGPRAIWKRDDIKSTIEVAPVQVRQIVLNGGRPMKSLPSLSHAALVNGDRIPGVLKSLDEEAIVLETSFGGEIRIVREQVGMIAPSPLGGRLLYHGPFSADEWTMITAASPEGLKKEVQPADKTDAQSPGLWAFSGSAWYWQATRPGTALVRKDGMPDRALVRFQVAWKNRLALAFAFHADFKRPPSKETDTPANPLAQQFAAADPSVFPRLFGNSYVIQMNGNNVMLYRAGFDDSGKPLLDAVRAANYNARFSEADSALVEMRCNRQTGEISLFINDEFVSQWSEEPEKMAGDSYAGKGSGFGFIVQGQGSPVRISEIVVAEWNGMPDSARSLQVDDQDIVLLANGTDRFSGKVTGFKDGAIQMEGRYGIFRFPLDDLAEVRFARNRLAKPLKSSENDLMIHLYPLGRLTGKPTGGDRSNLKILTPSAGEVNVHLDSAVILDFKPSANFLDDWDAPF